MKIHVKVKTIEDKIEQYVDNHQLDIYVDRDDGLTEEQVEMLLKGDKDGAMFDIEEWANNNPWDGEFDSYWEQCRKETGASQDDIDDWLDGDGHYPYYSLGDYEWKQFLRNTNVKIEAVLWDANFNVNNWAYGYPVSYSDVKDTLKLLGINPKDFKENVRGGSMTAGDGKLKGYFPDMPSRVPKIALKDLFDGMCSLYDGAVVFCLGDLENVSEALLDDPKNITFKKGTNVVIYEFAGGAGISDFPLIEDLTVPRKQVSFQVSGKYGIQDCYGFVSSYWEEGSICAA